MVDKIRTSFSPGDHVFLQGEIVPSFFKVNEGRFAKVLSKKSVRELGIKHMLNEADLIGIVSHQELFGEIEALSGRPQEFSVFALDESTVTEVPAHDAETLENHLKEDPIIGVKACVSFARYMKQFFSHFAAIAREEVELDAFLRNVARDYIAGVNELANAVLPVMNDSDYVASRTHKAYELARSILKQAETGTLSSASVSCSIVPDIDRTLGLQTFKAGTYLCRQGMIGDTLFIVTEGTAEVIIGGGNPNIVIDSPGSIVGEIAVFLNLDSPTHDMRRTADVVCATDVTAVVLQLGQVEEFFRQHPDVLTRMLKAMISRSDATQKLCDKAEARVKSLLYDTLGILLEGANNMALSLSRRNDNPALSRPGALFSHSARTTYNRFRESLKLLAARESIKP